MLQGIDMAQNIWVKSVPALKVKTTSRKPIPVASDLVQVLEELAKIHKDTYLKAYLLFVNSIPLFITLSINICFTYFNHITNRKVEAIFKDFKETHSYYMKCGLQITTLHEYGEFTPLQAMVYMHMPGRSHINLTSAN